MHVITRKRLNEFVEKYPETEKALIDWYRLIKQNYFFEFCGIANDIPVRR